MKTSKRGIKVHAAIAALAIGAASTALTAASPASAQSPEEEVQIEDIVVTATRTPTVRRKLGSSITVITAEDIEKQQATNVADVLRRVPGVNIQSNGGFGANTVAKFRGLEEEHTTVLVNGIRQNNPADARNTFNFEHLLTANIERIEIIRGPQATLYGSRANGAVINIITKKGSGDINGTLRIDGGSRRTGSIDGNVNMGGTTESGVGYDVSVNASSFETNGFSAANENRDPPGRPAITEDDGAEAHNIGFNAGIRPTNNSEIRVNFEHSQLFASFDRSSSRVAFDADRTKDVETYSYGILGRYDALDGKLENELQLAGTNNYEVQVYDLLVNNGSRSWTKSADYKGSYYFTDDDILTFGLGWNQERYARLDDDANNQAVKVQDFRKAQKNYFLQTQNGFFDRLFTTVGLSYDHVNDVHGSEFDGELTYRGGASFDIKETGTLLKGSYATGFAAPTLFQQFRFSDTGPLDPENLTLWDVGFEQEVLDDRIRFGATYFRNNIKDQIVFDRDTTTYVNRDEFRSEGLEATFDAKVYEKGDHRIDFSTNYTYTIALDQDNTEVDRNPRHSTNFALEYSFMGGKANLRLDGEWVSNHKDFYGSSTTVVKVGQRWKFDIAGDYKIRENLKLHGRIENVTDVDYESAAGFGQAPFGVFGGLTYTF